MLRFAAMSSRHTPNHLLRTNAPAIRIISYGGNFSLFITLKLFAFDPSFAIGVNFFFPDRHRTF